LLDCAASSAEPVSATPGDAAGKRGDAGVERGDYLGVCPRRVVVPVLNTTGCLPFERDAGDLCRQADLAAGAA
jgi:hypothetical protein